MLKLLYPKKKKSWNCPLCTFKVAACKNWSDKKMRHVRTWHPDKVDRMKHLQLDQEEKIRDAFAVEAVAAEDTCSWRCPLPGCGMGIRQAPGTGGERGAHRKERLGHAKDAHPRVPAQRFANRPKAGSAAEARIRTASANSVAAAQVAQLKAGDAGAHRRVQFVTMPAGFPLHRGSAVACCPAKARYSVAYCADCRTLAHGLKKLAKRPCTDSRKRARCPERSTTTKDLEARLRRRLGAAKPPEPAVRDELQACLDLIAPSPRMRAPSSLARPPATAAANPESENGGHC
jgi:hypothetical protein